MSNVTEDNEHTKISVAIGDFRVELEGTYTNIKEIMGKPLYEFIEGLQNVIGNVSSEETTETEEITPPAEYPPPVSKTSSLSEAIKILLNSDWGKKPRTFNEIVTALKTSGIYYTSGAFSATLNHLVKSGALRRIGKRRSFKYILA